MDAALHKSTAQRKQLYILLSESDQSIYGRSACNRASVTLSRGRVVL